MTPRETRSNCGNLHDQTLAARSLSDALLFLDDEQTRSKSKPRHSVSRKSADGKRWQKYSEFDAFAPTSNLIFGWPYRVKQTRNRGQVRIHKLFSEGPLRRFYLKSAHGNSSIRVTRFFRVIQASGCALPVTDRLQVRRAGRAKRSNIPHGGLAEEAAVLAIE